MMNECDDSKGDDCDDANLVATQRFGNFFQAILLGFGRSAYKLSSGYFVNRFPGKSPARHTRDARSCADRSIA
jgi:hypothetical protein